MPGRAARRENRGHACPGWGPTNAREQAWHAGQPWVLACSYTAQAPRAVRHLSSPYRPCVTPGGVPKAFILRLHRLRDGMLALLSATGTALLIVGLTVFALVYLVTKNRKGGAVPPPARVPAPPRLRTTPLC